MKIQKSNLNRPSRRLKEDYNDDPKRFDKVYEEFEKLYDLVVRNREIMGNAKDEEITNEYFKSFISDMDAKIYDIEELLK